MRHDTLIHETHMSKHLFVSHIEFIRSKLAIFLLLYPGLQTDGCRMRICSGSDIASLTRIAICSRPVLIRAGELPRWRARPAPRTGGAHERCTAVCWAALTRRCGFKSHRERRFSRQRRGGVPEYSPWQLTTWNFVCLLVRQAYIVHVKHMPNFDRFVYLLIGSKTATGRNPLTAAVNVHTQTHPSQSHKHEGTDIHSYTKYGCNDSFKWVNREIIYTWRCNKICKARHELKVQQIAL